MLDLVAKCCPLLIKKIWIGRRPAVAASCIVGSGRKYEAEKSFRLHGRRRRGEGKGRTKDEEEHQSFSLPPSLSLSLSPSSAKKLDVRLGR